MTHLYRFGLSFFYQFTGIPVFNLYLYYSTHTRPVPVKLLAVPVLTRMGIPTQP